MCTSMCIWDCGGGGGVKQTVCASVSSFGIINITSGLKSVEGEKAIYSEGDSPPPLIICMRVYVCLYLHVCKHACMHIQAYM